MRFHKTIKTGEKLQGGMNANNIAMQIKKEHRTIKSDEEKIHLDVENRKYISYLILENIRNGKTEEEALDIAMKDEKANAFDYLEKNGLNKRECFRNWARGYAKQESKKDRERER